MTSISSLPPVMPRFLATIFRMSSSDQVWVITVINEIAAVTIEFAAMIIHGDAVLGDVGLDKIVGAFFRLDHFSNRSSSRGS